MEPNEKDRAIQTGIALETYVSQGLSLLLKLNPVETLLPMMQSANKTETPLLSREDARVKGIIDSWLTMFDEALKAGRSAPADLLGRAAILARELNGRSRREHQEISRLLLGYSDPRVHSLMNWHVRFLGAGHRIAGHSLQMLDAIELLLGPEARARSFAASPG